MYFKRYVVKKVTKIFVNCGVNVELQVKGWVTFEYTLCNSSLQRHLLHCLRKVGW